MGKPSSPAKNPASSAATSTAMGGSRVVANGSTRDESCFEEDFDGVERLERLESTIVNRESATHLAFAKSRKEDFVYATTDHYVRILDDYCQWDRDGPHSSVLVIVSQPGQGKSALLANWAAKRRQSTVGAQEFIYEHYSGCSYDSVKLSVFLFRFMVQIKVSYALKDFELPREHEEEKLKFSLSRCLEAAVGKANHVMGSASKRKHIVLILDGIDCIRTEDGGDSLSWLPNTFPAGVRIIVSATQTGIPQSTQLQYCQQITRRPYVYDNDGDLVYDKTLPPHKHDSHTIRELRRRNALFMVVEPLDEQACRSILQLYEQKSLEKMDSEGMELLVTSRGSSSPMYMRLLLNGLELFSPKDETARRKWLMRACQATDLRFVYELLMRRWNELLLADLFENLNNYKTSVVDNGNPLQAVEREHKKLTRVVSTTHLGKEHSGSGGGNPSTDKSRYVPGNDSNEVESLQIAIEQRALLIRHTLSLLVVSRYGLSGTDLIRLFGDTVPRNVSQQLMKLLMPHLMQIRRLDCSFNTNTSNSCTDLRNNNHRDNHQMDNSNNEVVLYDLSHNQLRLITRYGFLSDDHLRSSYYRELAMYFEGMEACQRRVDELPVQLERCSMWSALQNSLVEIKMFQLWWNERNRQEFFSNWMQLKANCSIHDPVDDFIRSMDDYIVRENPSAEHLLSLFLTITEFLRTWQRIDTSSKSNHLTLSRPEPPQMQEFISGLGNVSTTHLPEREAKKIQHEIDALCIHADDGYYVRRWLWTQFPLIAVAFESRLLRSIVSNRVASGMATASDDGQMSENGGVGGEPGSFSSASTTSSTKSNHATVSMPLMDKLPSTVLPPATQSLKKNNLLSTKDKLKKTQIVAKPKSFPLKVANTSLDSTPEDDFGVFEFLSPENSVLSISSISTLESHLMELRMRYDKLKFAAKEKREGLQTLESRLLDARAHAKAVGQSTTQLEDLLEQTRVVNDETTMGRQRSEYYKSILRHCEVNPARDPNAIESAETVVNKLKADIVELQQKTQVVSYEKRLANIEIPKLQQVLQDKAKMQQTALERLRWRQELNYRMYPNTLPGKSHDHGAGSRSQSVLYLNHSSGSETSDDNWVTDENGIGPKADWNISRAKDKLLHKNETSLERQKKTQTLQMYVGSAYKDDGMLGALRQVGINKPEDAQVYWQDQLNHAEELEAEENEAEQRVVEYREKLEALQSQFLNLKLGGGSEEPESSPSSPAGSTAGFGTDNRVSKAHNIKLLEQQLADAMVQSQQKKERDARLKTLHEKLQLGLLHVAQILGVTSAHHMDSVTLADSIEQVVRLYVGDEGHLQSGSSSNLRRKNSVRIMGLAGQNGLSSSYVLPETRTVDDKIRFNIRVSHGVHHQTNPYTSADGDEWNSDDDMGNEDAEQEAGKNNPRGGDEDNVRQRQDIKNRSKVEIEKKLLAQKRAEKKKK